MHNLLTNFRRDGFGILPGLCDAKTVREWRQLAERERREQKRWIIGGWIERAPELALSLVAHPSVITLAEAIMGPFVQLDSLTVVGAPPVKKDSAASRVLHWHRDPFGHVPRCTEFERPLALNMLCYLQGLDEDVGPLRLIPGSHRKPLTLEPRLRKIPHPDEKLLFPRAGDAVLLHNNLVHSRTPNCSRRNRYYVTTLYSLSWLRPSTRFDGPRAKDLLARAQANNDHRRMRLLGLDMNLESRGNSGFLSDDEAMWKEWSTEDDAALLR